MTPKTKELIVGNKVKEWCDAHGIDEREYKSKCLASRATFNGRTLAEGTAKRAYNGASDISFGTAALITHALGAGSVADLFDLE